MNAFSTDIHGTAPSYFISLYEKPYAIKCFSYLTAAPQNTLIYVNNDIIVYEMRIFFTQILILIVLVLFLSVISCFSRLNLILTTATLNTTHTNILCDFNWHEAKLNSTEHTNTHTGYNLFESPWMVEVRSTQVVPDGHESSSKTFSLFNKIKRQ